MQEAGYAKPAILRPSGVFPSALPRSEADVCYAVARISHIMTDQLAKFLPQVSGWAINQLLRSLIVDEALQSSIRTAFLNFLDITPS